MGLAALAALVGASVQSATGFGFALILGPAVFAVLDPFEAVSALVLLGVVLNVLMLGDAFREVRGRELVPLLAGALPGLVGGVLVLEALSKSALQVTMGVLVVLAALVRMREHATGAAPQPGPPAGAVAVGGLAGVLTTSTSVNGPPLVLWLERRGLDLPQLRATVAAAFLALNLAGAVALAVGGGLDRLAGAGELLPLLAATAVGYAVGGVAFRRLDADLLRRAVLGLVLAAGVASVVAGLA